MTLERITETPLDQQQVALYGRASPMVKHSTYPLSAGAAWAVIGNVLADAAVPGDEGTLVDAMEALAEITTVANPRIWGQMPAELLINAGGDPDTHEALLLVESHLTAQVGYGDDVQDYSLRLFEQVKLPLGKQWMLTNCRLPAELASAQNIADLEAAIVGSHAGFTLAEHLIGGLVPPNASDVSLRITTRMKIVPIEAVE